MSGPSLEKHDAHSSIHESALNEAKELTNLLKQCLKEGDHDKVTRVAEVTIEHWETRTLAHAASEEEGLYKDIVAENPKLKDIVVQLTRDHDLMRRMVEQLKQFVINEEIDDRFIKLLDSLIIVDLIHNEDEMNKLLSAHRRSFIQNDQESKKKSG